MYLVLFEKTFRVINRSMYNYTFIVLIHLKYEIDMKCRYIKIIYIVLK